MHASVLGVGGKDLSNQPTNDGEPEEMV